MVKTSLERSHSKISNFKLTILAIFELFGFTGLWITLAVKDRVESWVFIVALIASLIVLLLGILGFRSFKR